MSASRSLSFPALARTGISARTMLLGLALLCLAAYCATGAYYVAAGSAHMMLNPNENTYPESLSVYTAVQGARLNRIYLPLYSPPYALQQYGPLFYIVNFGVARASHLDLELTRLRLRWLAYFSYLLSGLLAFLIVRRLGFPAWLAGFSGLMLLGQHYFIEWDTTVRPDMLCLLLMLLCLYVAVGEDAPSLGACLLSGFVGGLAFLAKQPGLAAPAAVAAMLLYRKSFRRAAWFTLAAAVPVAAVLGLLIYRHESFLEQFTSLGKGYWSLRQGALFAAAKMFDVRVLLPIGIGALGLVRAWRSSKNAPAIAAFALLSFAIGFSGLPQLGADVNYYLPGLAACALLLPFAVEAVREWTAEDFRGWMLVPVACLLLWTAWTARTLERRFLFMHFAPQDNRYAALAPYRIFSDRPIFTVHGREPDMLDPFTMHGLEVAGHWNSAPIAENLRRGDYDLIVLACEAMTMKVCHFRGVAYFSRPVVEAMNTNYEVLCSTFSERVLVPRSRTVSISPEMLQPVFGQRCGTNMRGNAPGVLFPADLR